MRLKLHTGLWILMLAPLQAVAQERPVLSFYGTPGLVEMPTAFSQPDGQFSLTTSHFGGTLRNTLTFQIAPRLSGSFRYSVIQDFDFGGSLNRYDRSFDVSYRLLSEANILPAVTIGLQDFGGTGIFAGEYVVASKKLTPKLSGTLGLGWGRFGTFGGFENPLAALHDGFKTRPGGPDSVAEVGRVEFDQWFRGDAAFFGGIQWQANEKLSFSAEYSSDAYTEETERGLIDRRSPFNFGLNYRFDNGIDLGGYYLYGSEFGLKVSFSFNPADPPFPGGREAAPPPVYARAGGPAEGWSEAWVSDAGQVADVRQAVADGLAEQGLELEALQVSGTSATLHLRNGRYDATPQALGRAARSLTRTLPPSVETFHIVPVVVGVPLSRVTLQRSDMEALEFELEGVWQSYVRASIGDAAGERPLRGTFAPGAYPQFSYSVNSYLAPSLFDPDSPVRADIGAELNVSYVPVPGLVFAGRLRQPIIGNLDEATRRSNSQLPHVRSDHTLYDIESDLELRHLTAEYFFRPGSNLYGRLTAGYLEEMYGGLSGEVLWKPVTGPLALGVEVNYAKQRDFDQGFGFQDYDIVTGHASAYYDFGKGYLGQVDVGRYLAGDWGATFGLDREFKNGFRVGAYFTLTDVPFDEFGEGSFDKGIRFSIPLSFISGDPSFRGFGTSISPVTRDGGARLVVRNRLYDVTRGFHDPYLRDRWGKFWR